MTDKNDDMREFETYKKCSARRDRDVREFVDAKIRTFKSGATRNIDDSKLDFEGFISPSVEHRFAQYMHQHRKQKDGSIRASDNWQAGIPEEVYIKSLVRHTMDLWYLMRGGSPIDPDTGTLCMKQDLLCAIKFNANGLLHEDLKRDIVSDVEDDLVDNLRREGL